MQMQTTENVLHSTFSAFAFALLNFNIEGKANIKG